MITFPFLETEIQKQVAPTLKLKSVACMRCLPFICEADFADFFIFQTVASITAFTKNYPQAQDIYD